ncbi:MAG: hypothetical protein ACUVQP_00055 [Bacteroidales bacterium]
MPEEKMLENQQDEVTPEVSESSESQQKEEPNKEDLRTKYALQLFDALEDPETAKLVVKNLAERLGLPVKSEAESTSQKQTSNVPKSLKQLVIERLGEENINAAEFADLIQSVIDERTEQIKNELRELETRRAAAEFSREYQKAIEELNITDEEAGALIELVDKFPYSGKQPVYDYLSELVEYHRMKAARKAASDNKRRTNLSQKPKTISSAAANEDNFTAPKISSAKEAVEFALRSLQKGE